MSSSVNLSDYKNIVFFTGAGLSVECGIPTYRGKGGLWHEYDYHEYACQRAFDRDPEKVWEFHDKRRKFISECNPSEGHKIIADIETAIPGTTVITQNIDGMHQRAGCKNVIELHGSLWRIRCDREDRVSENFEVPLKQKHCSCGETMRPDIVWFEDPLDQMVIKKAMVAVSQCDLLITIGTSAMVYPSAQIPFIAFQKQITSLEINIDPTPMTKMYTHFLRGSASEMLRSLWPENQSVHRRLSGC